MNTNASSWYGSNTWNIFSSDCERLYTSYNVTIRIVLQVDRCTHRYLIEPLSECLHLKTRIASRFVTFYNSLISSKKLPVRFLARICEKDLRTVLGRTLSTLLTKCQLKPEELPLLNSNLVKNKLCYREVPDDELWRVSLCKEMLRIQHGNQLELPGFENEECEELLKFACVS